MVLLASCFARTITKYHTHKPTCIYYTEKNKTKQNLQQNCGLCFIYSYIWGNLSHDIENKMLTFNIADICEFQLYTNTGEWLRFQNNHAYMQHIMHIMAQLAIRAENTGESYILRIYLHRSWKYCLLALKQRNFRTPNNTVLRKYYGRLPQRNWRVGVLRPVVIRISVQPKCHKYSTLEVTIFPRVDARLHFSFPN